MSKLGMDGNFGRERSESNYMNNFIYIIFARYGFGYGEETYLQEAYLDESEAVKRVAVLDDPEDGDTRYYYMKVKLCGELIKE